MIDYAQAKLGGTEQIDWQTADAANLPFPPNSFSAVACQFGLMFVPDKEAPFREAQRVLVDNGMYRRRPSVQVDDAGDCRVGARESCLIMPP